MRSGDRASCARVVLADRHRLGACGIPLPDPNDDKHPVARAAVTLGGVYRRVHRLDLSRLVQEAQTALRVSGSGGGDGWFGATYAGGADKFGHAWATMRSLAAARDPLAAAAATAASASLSAVLADALFFGVEVKDGFYYEFSPGDFRSTRGRARGARAGIFPRLDELFDFRVQYFPSGSTSKIDGTPPCAAPAARDSTSPRTTRARPTCSRSTSAGIHTLRDMPHGTGAAVRRRRRRVRQRGYKPNAGDPSSSA